MTRHNLALKEGNPIWTGGIVCAFVRKPKPMTKSRGLKRIGLILTLFAVAYAANWTDDYYGYWNATRSRAFAAANGHTSGVSGGQFDGGALLMALSAMNAQQNRPTDGSGSAADSSAVSEVFGKGLHSADSPNETDDFFGGGQGSSSRSLYGARTGKGGTGNSRMMQGNSFGPSTLPSAQTVFSIY